MANGFNNELLVWPYLVIDYARCDIIMAPIYSLAAFKVRAFLIYFELTRLNLTLLHTFLCASKDRLESVITHRYFSCSTILMFWPDIVIFEKNVTFFFWKTLLQFYLHWNEGKSSLANWLSHALLWLGSSQMFCFVQYTIVLSAYISSQPSISQKEKTCSACSVRTSTASSNPSSNPNWDLKIYINFPLEWRRHTCSCKQ